MTRCGTLADLEPGTQIGTVAGPATVLYRGPEFALIRFHDDDTQATLNPNQEPFAVLARPNRPHDVDAVGAGRQTADETTDRPEDHR